MKVFKRRSLNQWEAYEVLKSLSDSVQETKTHVLEVLEVGFWGTAS